MGLEFLEASRIFVYIFYYNIKLLIAYFGVIPSSEFWLVCIVIPASKANTSRLKNWYCCLFLNNNILGQWVKKIRSTDRRSRLRALVLQWGRDWIAVNKAAESGSFILCPRSLKPTSDRSLYQQHINHVPSPAPKETAPTRSVSPRSHQRLADN
jgi:hypothetical protein